MPMWAVGSSCYSSLRARSVQGFTLLELMVVVAIIAMATAGVSFAMRDNGQIQLEREAQRLVALLESARSQSRASGVAVRWRVTAQGFVFEGLPAAALPQHWLTAGTTVRDAATLILGPEPLIARQSIILDSSEASGHGLRIATDGLRPFTVEPADSADPVKAPA
jgi:general secretion pathway protein H